jgi:hypothetical protein
LFYIEPSQNYFFPVSRSAARFDFHRIAVYHRHCARFAAAQFLFPAGTILMAHARCIIFRAKTKALLIL